ncbi:Flagellar biogenesis protein FliO [Devosia crocina]|uniref:Flagellar biogenesis protein FliO n=1 Tax=Devosia crocina TaxID=429728 RepID=A0A1I7N836_9HYPH|nr:flagellar biosynthetic protein FliO [Devosia crocina]SFV30821.1 Flagellar biogenesis protein FliO [Devosia crocina]
MNFLTSLFGGTENALLTALFALGIVLVLIVLGVWLLKLVFRVSSNGVRGRNRRLGIVDSLVLDQKRQLLMVRRDDVEHLILVGGPQDVVIESGIVPPEETATQPTRRQMPIANGRRPSQTSEPKVAIPPASAAAGHGAAIDRAREANRTREPAPRSLRHTGLLRPVGNPDAAPAVHSADISPAHYADSVNEETTKLANEGAGRDHDTPSEANRN